MKTRKVILEKNKRQGRVKAIAANFAQLWWQINASTNSRWLILYIETALLKSGHIWLFSLQQTMYFKTLLFIGNWSFVTHFYQSRFSFLLIKSVMWTLTALVLENPHVIARRTLCKHTWSKNEHQIPVFGQVMNSV